MQAQPESVFIENVGSARYCFSSGKEGQGRGITFPTQTREALFASSKILMGEHFPPVVTYEFPILTKVSPLKNIEGCMMCC